MALDEKSNQRKEGYIEGYKLMINDISEEINIKKPNELNNDEAEELKSSIRSEDINKESDDGCTPLFDVIMNGNEVLAKYLVKHGADINLL